MDAAFFNRPGVVKPLLEHDADITIKNDEGKTALDIALEKGNKEIVKLLEDVMAKQQK